MHKGEVQPVLKLVSVQPKSKIVQTAEIYT